MSRHKKTRKEKMLSDLRRKNYNLDRKFFSEKLDSQNETEIKTPTIAVVNQYPHLISDIEKTGILTLFILAFQIILFFLLRKHLITLPGITY